MKQNIFNKIKIGFIRNPKSFFTYLIVSFTLLWTFIEPVLGLTNIELKGWISIIIFVLIGIFIATFKIIPSKEIEFRLKNTNTKIKILYGDLFKTESNKIISVNEYFDSEIGKLVSPNSVHGLFIKNILGGHKETFDKSVERYLCEYKNEYKERKEGKKFIYPIGSTAVVEFNNEKFIIFALCKTDDEYKAYCNPSMMLFALEGLWNRVRTESNGYDVNIPLVGGGLAGIGLPSIQLLELILISILKSTKVQEIGCKINIILLPNLYQEINLDLIKLNWE